MIPDVSLARRGRFEGRRDDSVTGWAYDAADPERRSEVLLFQDGCNPVRLLADRYRGDVQAAGHTDGCCGFAVSAPSSAEVLHCIWADDGTDLPGSPLKRPQRPRRLSGRCGALRASVDWPLAGAQFLTGSLLDRHAPQRRLVVALVCDGRIASQGRACLYRDTTAGSADDGLHGFSLGVPDASSAISHAALMDLQTARVIVELNRRWMTALGWR